MHFHFFKNAGTSVETTLRRQFGNRFISHEPGGASETHPASVLIPVLEQNPGVQAVSSHTICFPLPVFRAWKFFPIVFIRHPLDRVLSLYNFEKNQYSRSPGAILAKKHDLAGYVSARLRDPGERTIRNYQTWMLAHKLVSPDAHEPLLEAATAVVEEIPVVGVVDEFSRSIRRFSDWLAPHFPGLDLTPRHRNRSRMARLTLDQRLNRLADAIGDPLMQQLRQENALDLELHRLARQRIQEKT